MVLNTGRAWRTTRGNTRHWIRSMSEQADRMDGWSVIRGSGSDGQNGNTGSVYISELPRGWRDGVECKDGDRRRRSERWRMTTSADGVRAKKREREQQRQKGTWQSIFYVCFFFFYPEEDAVLLGDCRSGRRDRWSAPSRYSGRIWGEDAGCMLIKQNTNWQSRKEAAAPTIFSFRLPLLSFSPLSPAGGQSLMSANQVVIGSTLSGAPQTVWLQDVPSVCLSACLSGCQT